jgi:spermidine dehydrogenase
MKERLLGPHVTRRDFIGGTLAGTGTMLLSGCSPAEQGGAAGGAYGPGEAWNGPSGYGDYAGSNGNTWATAQAAHRIRDGDYADGASETADIGELFDLVIVGGGFTGLGALHEFRKSHPKLKVLLLDNQEIFGGYGKANSFAFRGSRLQGPQASLNFMLPRESSDRGAELWRELQLPTTFDTVNVRGANPALKFAKSTSAPLYLGEQSASLGYWFGPEHGFVRDIWSDDLIRAPFPPETRAALLRLRARRRLGKPEEAEARRLDGMTFADFARQELGATDAALAYITDGMCITGPQISAYGARSLPGLERFAPGTKEADLAERFLSFPGGNALLARAMVKAAVPNAFAASGLEDLSRTPLNRTALDQDGSPARIRQRATVVRVAHVGGSAGAELVEVAYAQGNKLARVRARGVVMGIGSWITKHVVADLPDDQTAALAKFFYSPMLMVNVAVHNWRFLDKAGFSAARWFNGLGFFTNVRQPLQLGSEQQRFGPDHPAVMTMYVNFPEPNLPLEAQGPTARQRLFSTSFAEYERQVVEQFSAMFSPYGFNAKRDIAGIILNRWGHAFVTPPPGFFFGTDGEAAPLTLATRRFNRISFGQTGLEDWVGATEAGKRAVRELGYA